MSPTKTPRYLSDSSSDDDSPPSKRMRAGSTGSWDGYFNKPLKVFIVQPKLQPDTVAELYDLCDPCESSQHENDTDHLNISLCNEPAYADIIITGIHMRKRLERHVDWNVARQKAIVTADWLRDSVKADKPLPCGDYAALSELHDETVENCPDCSDCKNTDGSQSQERQKERTGYPSPPLSQASAAAQSGNQEHASRSFTPAEDDHTSASVKKNWMASYACQRASPLVCPNQALVTELGVLHRSRELEGKNINALSYERAIAILKSYPNVITKENFKRDVIKLPHIGEKIGSKIKEFLDKGYIEESETIRNSQRFKSLTLFSSVHGIGPSTARTLYDTGLRTIEDMERYYDVPPGADSTILEELDAEQATPNGRKILSRDKLPALSIKVAIALRKDLDIKIPREEVERIYATVMSDLEKVQPGCVGTVVGGYRRGKPESNDVDIVISHSDIKNGANLVKGLCHRLTKHLHEKGIVTHVMHLSGFHAHDALKTEHWDSLEKALTVFVLPPPKGSRKLYRRVDLIFAEPDAYWTAVTGWTGSKMFERDLRLWAKQEKGMKFDSAGLTRRHDSRLYVPRSEIDVFKILGLEWIDPSLRNADI